MRSPRSVMSFAGALAMLFSSAAFAQGAGNYPAKLVMMVLPYATGGSTDIEARIHAVKLSEMLGQQFVVDYKPGAGTTIGTNFVARAAPDGYTLLIASGSHTIAPSLYKDLPFDNIKDFATIALVGRYPQAIVVHSAFPSKTMAEYIAYAKANPGKVNFGTGGAGNVGHLVGEKLHSATNTKATFVHYKLFASLMTDLISGRVDSISTSLQGALPQVKAGKLRFLAVTSNVRTKLLPDVPTVAETLGLADFDVANWTGYVAPAATPAAIVNRLADAFAKVSKLPEVMANVDAVGGVAIYAGPAQFRQYLVNETEQWRKVITENGIKLEE